MSDVNMLAQRACDQCRVRKIRCDRQLPCSNCTTTVQSCSFTRSGLKTREPRQRVLISTQYERKIDNIEQQLVDIGKTLQYMSQIQQPTPRTATTESQSSVSRSPYTTTSSTPSYSPAEPRNHVSHEGASTVAAHTAVASRYLGAAVEHHLGTTVTPEAHNTLESLRRLLDIHHTAPGSDSCQFANQKSLPTNGLRGLSMPPSDAVLSILRELKEQSIIMFNLICCLQGGTEYFMDQCRRVYFATENYTHATFVIVTAGLYYLFHEKATLNGDQAEAASLRGYQNKCRDNLETALSNLPLIMPASRQNVEALVLGASYAIGISRPAIAWQLTVKACEMCLTLGYHQVRSQRDDDADQQGEDNVLFWFVYMYDKALSLRLGCSSKLHDYEITISRNLRPFDEFDEHREIIEEWITYAQVQGQIYDGLYSPRALSQSLKHRVHTARNCIDNLETWLQRLGQLRTLRDRNLEEHRDSRSIVKAILVRSEEVAALSMLTLVHRGLPSSYKDDHRSVAMNSGAECIYFARETLRRHFECVEMIQNYPMLAVVYMHWTIMFSPFIAFIVLFCESLEKCRAEDLQWLERFKLSIDPWRSVSEAVDRLARLSQVLYEAASQYVKLKRTRGIENPQAQGTSGEHVVNDELYSCLYQFDFLDPRLPFLQSQELGGTEMLQAANMVGTVAMEDWHTERRSDSGG